MIICQPDTAQLDDKLWLVPVKEDSRIAPVTLRVKIVLFLSLRLDQGSKPYPFQFKRERERGKKFSTAKDVDLSPGLCWACFFFGNGMMVMMKPDALQRAAIWKRWALMLKIVFEHTNSPLLHTIKISLKTSLLGNVHARAKFFFFPLLISINLRFHL